MTQYLTTVELAERLLATEAGRRRIVAIAGAPGSGKSTAADDIKELINGRCPRLVDILSMDGFHFDDMVLTARGHRSRKGAPHTFDLEGFRVMLERLIEDNGSDIAVPVFDRSIEISRAGAHIIEAPTRILLTEGNYLLLEEPGWRDLRSLFDLTVMLHESEVVLTERLEQRWRGLGLDPSAVRNKLESNDLPNMRLILSQSSAPDIVIQGAKEIPGPFL